MMTLRWLLILTLGFAAGWWLRGWLPEGLDKEQRATPHPVASAPAQLPAEPGLREQFEQLLAAQEWDAAVALYVRAEAGGTDPEQAAALRDRILAAGRVVSGRRDLEAALALLERYTFLHHRDVEAHYRLAEAAERLGRPQLALSALLDALDVELTGPDPEPARTRVAELVDALVAGRLAIDDRSGAMRLYQQVLDRDPLNHRYRFLLAKRLEAAGEYRAAQRTLDEIPADGHDPVSVADLQRRIAESSALATRFADGLPLTRFGEHFLVDAVLDDGRPLRLLLDTGATRSVLKPQVVARAPGAERLPQRVRIGTANGVVSASRYRLPGLTLGPFRIDAPVLVVLDLEGLSGVDGLLGLDLLGRFDYRIDPGSGRLLLAR
ncbi:MAG: hypothetical protein EA417_04325 [Gammaproteobacteria bacterium]|nr:MAG: hypothetical protein EA417_04325 [Gammaproteobacteria bacterium]